MGGRSQDKIPDNPDVPIEPPTRARASAELADRFADLLAEEHSHQLGVCGQLGIAYATYKRWMSDDEDASPEVAAFRAIVLRALDARRKEDMRQAREAVEGAPGTHAATVWNMRKWAHEQRFKRFYAEEPARVELTGKDGGAIDFRNMSTEDLLATVLATGQKPDEDE